MIRATSLLAFCCCLAGLSSSSANAQVVPTSAGSVEFLGLETWTPVEIQKRLGYTSPDRLHYCAIDLKKIGFPEAAVIAYRENGRRVTIVTVVEPQRAAEIVYKPRPVQHILLPKQWMTLSQAAGDPSFLEGGVLDYGRGLPNSLTDRPWLSDGTRQTWWPAAQALQKKDDFRLALRVLNQANDANARTAAAVVLMNFSEEDAAWRSLVSGLRDPDPLVQSTCLQALNSLATYHPRTVDWAPAVGDLVDLLHGTDLFAFDFVLKTLSATNISPALARPLLSHGGARLAIAYLGAHHEDQRDLAHQFLIAMAGRDLGAESAPWENWVARLS